MPGTFHARSADTGTTRPHRSRYRRDRPTSDCVTAAIWEFFTGTMNFNTRLKAYARRYVHDKAVLQRERKRERLRGILCRGLVTPPPLAESDGQWGTSFLLSARKAARITYLQCADVKIPPPSPLTPPQEHRRYCALARARARARSSAQNVNTAVR